MQCERCHKEREDGRTYLFSYGCKGRPETSIELDRMAKVTRTPIGVAGQESVWLCRRVFGRYELVLGLSLGVLVVFALVVLFAGLALSFQKQSSPTTVTGTCLTVPAVLMLVLTLGIAVWYARSGRQRTNLGERLAIRLRKAALQRQGYDTFLTTEQYKRLESHKTPSA